MEYKIEELNREYNKYSQDIVKLLDASLKEGEVYIFKKLSDGGYGLVLSRERERLLDVYREDGAVSVWDILNILETKPLFL